MVGRRGVEPRESQTPDLQSGPAPIWQLAPLLAHENSEAAGDRASRARAYGFIWRVTFFAHGSKTELLLVPKSSAVMLLTAPTAPCAKIKLSPAKIFTRTARATSALQRNAKLIAELSLLLADQDPSSNSFMYVTALIPRDPRAGCSLKRFQQNSMQVATGSSMCVQLVSSYRWANGTLSGSLTVQPDAASARVPGEFARYGPRKDESATASSRQRPHRQAEHQIDPRCTP